MAFGFSVTQMTESGAIPYNVNIATLSTHEWSQCNDSYWTAQWPSGSVRITSSKNKGDDEASRAGSRPRKSEKCKLFRNLMKYCNWSDLDQIFSMLCKYKQNKFKNKTWCIYRQWLWNTLRYHSTMFSGDWEELNTLSGLGEEAQETAEKRVEPEASGTTIRFVNPYSSTPYIKKNVRLNLFEYINDPHVLTWTWER